MIDSFKALMVRNIDGKYVPKVEAVPFAALEQNEVLIKVSYSSVNFKDTLSASGNPGVTTKFPHVPGVDAVGEIVSSSTESFKPGQQVIVHCYDLGQNTWGGFGEYISVPASWLIPLPEKLSPLEAMSYGTAGLTSGVSIYELIQSDIKPEDGKIVVSGATGGVGSYSIAILKKLGYEVVAISGKKENDFLTKTLGADEIISRDEFIEKYDAGLMSSADFAGGIDAVGGRILSGIIKSLKYGGAVTACGMVASLEFSTSVAPFILRGVTLKGIDVVQKSVEYRGKIWNLIADDWKPAVITDVIKEISLEELLATLTEVHQGKAVGRYVVKHK